MFRTAMNEWLDEQGEMGRFLADQFRAYFAANSQPSAPSAK
jgi:hypothetical protein